MANDPQLKGLRALVTGGTKGTAKLCDAPAGSRRAEVLSTAHSPVRATADAMFVAAYLSSAEGCAIVAEAVDKSLGGGSLEDLPHSRGGFVVLDENERQRN